MGTQPPQTQTYPRGRHSAKPGEFRARIEAMYPTAAKLELFARGAPAPGWDAWGDQVSTLLGRNSAPTAFVPALQAAETRERDALNVPSNSMKS